MSLSNTVYQFYWCILHGCEHLNDRNEEHIEKYNKTLKIEQFVRNLGYNVVIVWESKNTVKKNMYFERKFILYDHLLYTILKRYPNW